MQKKIRLERFDAAEKDKSDFVDDKQVFIATVDKKLYNGATSQYGHLLELKSDSSHKNLKSAGPMLKFYPPQ